MGQLVRLPVVTKSAVAKTLADSTLSKGSATVGTGREKVGGVLLAYADFEDPRRPGEVTRLYIESES